MESINILFPMISGVLVVPIIKWVKTKVQTDVPLLFWFLTLAINAILVFGLAYFLEPTISLNVILEILIAQVTSQGGHAFTKTKTKLLIGDAKE